MAKKLFQLDQIIKDAESVKEVPSLVQLANNSFIKSDLFQFTSGDCVCFDQSVNVWFDKKPDNNFTYSKQGERGNVKVYIINSQKNAITRSPDNKLQSYINFEGRGTSMSGSIKSLTTILRTPSIN